MKKNFLLCFVLLLSACSGGGDGGSATTTTRPPPPPSVATITDGAVRISTQNPYIAGCDGVAATGTLYPNAEVEPFVAVNPTNANNIIAVWQQNRWSDGASHGNATGFSLDRGQTWALRTPTFSRCAGGNAGNSGDYERASDPWVTFSPNGVAHQMALSISGNSFSPGSASAMLASRSTDGGQSWSAASTLIRDGAGFFNDKNAMTAHPRDARFVFAVWDRLVQSGGGPSYLARSIDNGLTWEPARSIFNPGANAQTIGNQVVVTPAGTIINFFTLIEFGVGTSTSFAVTRSSDNGATWGAPIRVANVTSIGTRDPETGAVVRDGSTLGAIAVAPNDSIYAVWQDARQTAGARDAILITRSSDDGFTWSAPVRVNADASVAAFTPSIAVKADGTIGVSYYDFRSNTTDPATLPTDYWLARSSDGGNTWREARIAGPFDLANAPIARGYFLGDYQGLASIDAQFLAVYARSNTGDTANRNDIFARLMTATDSSVAASSSAYAAKRTGEQTMSAQFERDVSAAIVRKLEQRVPGSTKQMQAR